MVGGEIQDEHFGLGELHVEPVHLCHFTCSYCGVGISLKHNVQTYNKIETWEYTCMNGYNSSLKWVI